MTGLTMFKKMRNLRSDPWRKVVWARGTPKETGFPRVMLSQRLRCDQALAQVLSPWLWVRPIASDNQASPETLTFTASSCPQFQEKED